MPTVTRRRAVRTLCGTLILATACTLPPPQPLDAVSDALGALTQEFQRTSGAPGVSVAVLHRGRLRFLAASGRADIERDLPATAVTVYPVGSVAKQVTAALVLQLVEEGYLDLSDSIGDHLPDLPPAWRDVTVEQLLNHTSGIPSFTEIGVRWTAALEAEVPPESLLALTAAEPMWFTPGTRWRYDNTGYVLLGLIVERIERRALAQVVETRIRQPLGLARFRTCSAAPTEPDRAAGYEPRVGDAAAGAPAAVMPARRLHMSQAFAAGDLCATVTDLVHWQRAMLGGRVLSPMMRAEMTTPRGAAAPWRYGLGVMADTLGGRKIVFHGGDIFGFTAATLAVPDEDLQIAVSVNVSNADAEGFALDLARILLGLPLPTPPVEAPLPDEDRRAAVGRYRVEIPGAETPVALVATDGGLALELAPGNGMPLRFYGRRQADGAALLEFGADFDARFRLLLTLRDGRVVGGTLVQGSGRFVVTRLP